MRHAASMDPLPLFPAFSITARRFWASFSSITMIRTRSFSSVCASMCRSSICFPVVRESTGGRSFPAHWRQTSSRAPFSSERTAVLSAATGPISSVRMFWLASACSAGGGVSVSAPFVKERRNAPMFHFAITNSPLSMNRLRRSLIQQPV